MSGKTKFRFQLKATLAGSMILPFVTLSAFAQQASDAAASGAPPAPQVIEKTTVTGTNIKRTSTETPSPVQVISAEDLKRSGYSSISDVLHDLTSNNMGSLTQANPSAFAAGGSGVSLRGLTVGGTLVLIDGHRMSTYPMPDDGERSFVDLSSIPFDAIERIEVLKDGASAIYGSDAIAGVVNVILKKSLVGTTVSVESGITSRGDGQTQHATASTGWGSLADDGYNAYIALEYRKQDSIPVDDRPYLAITDWTRYGGANLTEGANAFGLWSGLPYSVTGYLVSPAAPVNNAGNPNVTYMYPGCSQAQLIASQCTYVNHALTLQPATQNIDLLGRFTKSLENDWEMNIQASVFNSQAVQAGTYNSTAPYGNTGNTNVIFSPSVNPPVPFAPNNFPYEVIVQPGRNNPTGVPAALIYNFPDVGAQIQKTTTNSYRFVGELTGAVAGWDIEASAGLTRVTTDLVNLNYLDLPNLTTALNNGRYIVGGHNSQSVLNYIAPAAAFESSSDLDFFTLRASRDVLTLPGGPMSVGVGLDFTHNALDEQFPGTFANGEQVSQIYSFAVGDQNVTSVYAELAAPVLKNLEFDAAARYDAYSKFDNLAPKLGFKYDPIPELTLRGTYSQGFRAPNIAESGNAGSTSGLLPVAFNPAVCTGAVNPNNCESIFVPNIQLSNPGLKPEKSESYTLGFILEPNRIFNVSVDYYRIQIKDQILSVGLLGENQYLYPQQFGVVFYPNLPNIAYDTYPFINADKTFTDGVDIDLRGRFGLGDFGKITASFEFTRMFDYKLTLPTLGTFQLAGTHGPNFISGDTGTPKNRASLTGTWTYGPFDLTATVNYIDHYTLTDTSYAIDTCGEAISITFPNTVPKQFCEVPSFTTVNLTARYAINKNWSLHAGIINLFDRQAPYDLQTFGSAGNGAQYGGAPYNPALAQDGAIGRFYNIGASYSF